MNASMTGKKLCALLPLLISLLFPAIGKAGVVTEVTVNKSILLNLQKPSERVSIATPSIAELVVISPSQLQINGTKIGSTTLIVWEKGGKTSFFDVRVKGDTSQLEEQIREIAPNDSITVNYANDTIVLGGKAANEQTILKAFQVARAYAAKESDSNEQETRQSASPPNMRNNEYNETRNELRGSIESDSDGGRKIKVLNHIQVDNPHQVLLEVKVAQVDKTALKSLGLSFFGRGQTGEGFSNLVGAPNGELTVRDAFGNTRSQATGIAGPIPGLAAINPLDAYQLGVSLFKPGIGAVLKALVTKGMAKVLAEPNLLVKSGRNGKFLAGKKYPITVVTGVGALSGVEVKYIDVGVKLNFKPVVLENGLIALNIDPAEVSVVTGFLPGAVNNYPIIDTREIRSDVQLKDGESLVMAGLLQEEAIKTMSKIPLLGDMPILGALFRTTEDQLKETELVFFITPKIVKPNAPGFEAELPTDQPLTPEQEKELQWIPEFK